MKIAVLGTGTVGRALAGRLSGLGHDVTIGTRDPQATLARTEPDGMGNPPYSTWAKAHPEVAVATFGEAAADAELSSTRPTARARSRRWSRPVPTASPARCCSTSPTRSTSPRASLPPCSSRTPTPSVSRSSGPSRRPGWSRPSTRSTPTSWSHPATLARSVGLRLRRRRGREGHGHRTAGELRPHRRHRPRRHHHRPRHRDAATGVAAAHGSPGHRRIQLQDRPLRWAP